MAAPSGDRGAPGGHWWFWFSWAEHIAKITDIGTARVRIEIVLSSRPSEPA
jgi:hypothetical protein